MAMTVNPAVESPAWDCAYLLHRPEAIPAGFCFPEGAEPFTTGVCLPRRVSQNRPGTSPERLLLFRSYLVVAEYPDPPRSEHRIPLSTVQFIESGRLLFERWFSVVTADSIHRFQYLFRDQACVDVFLYDLRHRLVRALAATGLVQGLSCGAPLEVKFSCAEVDEVDPDEYVLIRFFNPHICTVQRHHWFFHRKLWFPADYLALTNRRVLWLTDRCNGQPETGGIIARYCAIGSIKQVSLERGECGWELRVGFAGARAWQIPVAPGLIESARSFIEVLSARVAVGAQSSDARKSA